MNKSNYYKLYDEEEPDYNCVIRTNIPCSELIKNLVAIYQEQGYIDEEDEYFDEEKNKLLEWAKEGLYEVYDKIGLDDSNDFDHKATEIVDNFIDNLDIMGNTEQYVVGTLRDLGIDVECIEFDEEIPY